MSVAARSPAALADASTPRPSYRSVSYTNCHESTVDVQDRSVRGRETGKNHVLVSSKMFKVHVPVNLANYSHAVFSR